MARYTMMQLLGSEFRNWTHTIKVKTGESLCGFTVRDIVAMADKEWWLVEGNFPEANCPDCVRKVAERRSR